MNAQLALAPLPSPSPISPILRGLIVTAAVLVLAGCKESNSAATPAGAEAANPAGAPGSAAPAPATTTVAAAPVIPATVRDAAAMLDLSSVAMLPAAENPGERTVTSLTYRASGSVDDAVKLHRDQILKAGWTEQPAASFTPQYASAVYVKGGYTLSLTVMPDQPGKVSVMLRHHGNVALENLPVPAGAKKLYGGPSTAIFSTDTPVDAATNEVATALAKAGWSPLSTAGKIRSFQQNAVKLTAMIDSAPAQGGKTTINFTSEMLPFDIPAMDGATDVEMSHGLKRLTFTMKQPAQECLATYGAVLAKSGWKMTSEAPAAIKPGEEIMFRNSVNDLLRLSFQPGSNGETRVTAAYMTVADIAEMNRKLDAQAEAYKAKQLEKQ